MSFADYSTSPDANGSIAGINVAEQCPPGGINNAIRQLMADGKQLADQVGGGTSTVPKSGGAFTGEITREGQGGYLHFASGSFIDARVHLLPQGSPRPSNPAEGTLVFYYA